MALFVLSLAITVLDRTFAESRGIPLSLGIIRASWVAGGVMIVAITLGVLTLRRDMD